MEGSWQEALSCFPCLAALAPPERWRLHLLAAQFLRAQTLEGAAGLRVDDSIRATIAAQACLLILNLGMDFYRDWSSVIVYPGEFRVRREFRDGSGVVHERSQVLSGESWQRGPVVLSWRAAAQPAVPGRNVVLHELAHKIDMLNGKANGFPPLHAGMDARQWTPDFGAAYDDLCRRLDAGETPRVDPYAAIDPGEFFCRGERSVLCRARRHSGGIPARLWPAGQILPPGPQRTRLSATPLRDGRRGSAREIAVVQVGQQQRPQSLLHIRRQMAEGSHHPAAVRRTAGAGKSAKILLIDGGAVVPGDLFIRFNVAQRIQGETTAETRVGPA